MVDVFTVKRIDVKYIRITKKNIVNAKIVICKSNIIHTKIRFRKCF